MAERTKGWNAARAKSRDDLDLHTAEGFNRAVDAYMRLHGISRAEAETALRNQMTERIPAAAIAKAS